MTERPILFSAEMVRAILDGRKTQTRRVMKPNEFEWPKSASRQIDDPGVNGLNCRYGQPGDQLWVRETFCAHWGAQPHDAPQSYRIVTGDKLPPIKQENGDLYQPVPSDIMTIWQLWVRETFCAHWGAQPHDAPQSYRIVTGDKLPPIKQENGDLYQPVPSDIMTIWYEAEGNKPFHMEWKLPDEMPRWASRIRLRITDIRVERLQDITEDDAKTEGVKPLDYAAHHVADGCGARIAFEQLWNKINGPGAWYENPWVWAISFERVKP